MSAAATAISAGIRVSRPQFYLAGREDIVLGQGLQRMSVCERVEGLYHCEARFGNWGPKGNAIVFLYFERQKLVSARRYRSRSTATSSLTAEFRRWRASSAKACRRRSRFYWKTASRTCA